MFLAEQSHQVVIDAIINSAPLAIGKLGANECNALYRHINNIPVFVPDLASYLMLPELRPTPGVPEPITEAITFH